MRLHLLGCSFFRHDAYYSRIPSLRVVPVVGPGPMGLRLCGARSRRTGTICASCRARSRTIWGQVLGDRLGVGASYGARSRASCRAMPVVGPGPGDRMGPGPGEPTWGQTLLSFIRGTSCRARPLGRLSTPTIFTILLQYFYSSLTILPAGIAIIYASPRVRWRRNVIERKES